MPMFCLVSLISFSILSLSCKRRIATAPIFVVGKESESDPDNSVRRSEASLVSELKLKEEQKMNMVIKQTRYSLKQCSSYRVSIPLYSCIIDRDTCITYGPSTQLIDKLYGILKCQLK